MSALSDIRKEILVEGLDDYVGLWELPWILRRRKPESTDDEVRERALEILSPLLREGLIEAGALRDDGDFLPWPCTPEEALARIDKEWRELGQDPNIGQVCWFSNTASGDRAAEGEV